MTSKSALRRRRKPFVPSGTPRQQDAWTREIERQLGREMRSVQRKARQLERLIIQIADRRAASKPIDAYDLCNVLNAGAAGYQVRCLAGVDSLTPRGAVIDKILDIQPIPP